MKFIWTHNTGYNDIMYSTPYRPYVGAHKNIWEPIILGFQMVEISSGGRNAHGESPLLKLKRHDC